MHIDSYYYYFCFLVYLNRETIANFQLIYQIKDFRFNFKLSIKKNSFFLEFNKSNYLMRLLLISFFLFYLLNFFNGFL